MAENLAVNLDELLGPIAGEDPAGATVPFSLRTELEEARKEDDPDLFSPSADRAEPHKADWPKIERLARKTLQTTSKDLLVAARLTEAFTRLRGFSGLADGLVLLRRLIEECWDRVHPAIEDGDLEVRAGPFNWLADADRGARFPNTVRTVPLVEAGEGVFYSWRDWRNGQDHKGKVTPELFDKAVTAVPREKCKAQVEDLQRCQAELAALTASLNQRLGPQSPSLGGLRQALDDCLTLTRQILQRKGPDPAAAEGQGGAEGNGKGGATGGGQGAARPLVTRADVYQRLGEAADLLARIEPHSPVPYLIRKAIEWGSLPFPELIRALVRDEAVLGTVNREVGIKPPEKK